MPGRYEAIESVWDQVRDEAVCAIVCLTEKDEIHEKSADYAQALKLGAVPCLVLSLEILDRGRTATLAVCVLLALGEPVTNASSVVSLAGSTIEIQRHR